MIKLKELLNVTEQAPQPPGAPVPVQTAPTGAPTQPPVPVGGEPTPDTAPTPDDPS